MKEICFITYRLGGGGAERVMTTTANYLSNNGYKVKMYETMPGTTIDYDIDEKITIIRENVSSNKFKQYNFLKKILKENKNAIFISFFTALNIMLLFVNIFYKRKVIVSERNDPAKTCHRKFMFWLRNKLYKKAKAVVFQTQDAMSYFGKICKHNGDIILNPIKGNLPKYDFSNRNGNVITFCRLDSQKNIPMYIEAIKLVNRVLPNVKFDIYGEGPSEEEIKELILKNDLEKVIYLHKFSSEIHNIAKNYSLFVLPSDYEGISNSMLEALGIGIPTICTDCPIGGARAIIQHGENGILVPVNNPQVLANEIIHILNDNDLARKLSSNALKINELLAVEKIGNQWAKLIEKVENKK